LARGVRYSVYSVVGLSAFGAYLYVDQFPGYRAFLWGALGIAAALVAGCVLFAAALTVAAVRQMGLRGVAWVLQADDPPRG